MMKVKFAILGCGRIANRHAQHIIRHPEGELVAAFDIHRHRMEGFCKKHGCDADTTPEALLARTDIDIVNVCTPNGLHAEGAIAALKSGKHVLVEKPMALTKADCEAMISASLNHNRQLFIVKQNRYNPPVVAVKQLVDNGSLGKVYQVVLNCYWNRSEQYYKESDWKGRKRLDGGTLFTQFSHFIDIAFYLFGDMDEHPCGFLKNANHRDLIDFEDSGVFSFTFRSGALGQLSYTTSCYDKNMEGSITIFAENGTIKIGGQYLNTLDYVATNNLILPEMPGTSNAPNDYGHYQGSMSNHDKVISNVIETLNGRSAIMTNALEGMKVVEMIENMYAKAQWVSP